MTNGELVKSCCEKLIKLMDTAGDKRSWGQDITKEEVSTTLDVLEMIAEHHIIYEALTK